jgi:hypothetical protein
MNSIEKQQLLEKTIQAIAPAIEDEGRNQFLQNTAIRGSGW